METSALEMEKKIVFFEEKSCYIIKKWSLGIRCDLFVIYSIGYTKNTL